MKILLVNSYYAPNLHGGAERCVQLLAEGLLARGHIPTVLTLSEDSTSRTREVASVKVHYISSNNKLSHIRMHNHTAVSKALWQLVTPIHPGMLKAVRHVLKQEKPDLIHTNILAGFSTKIWHLASECGIPALHTLHDYHLICPRGTMFKGTAGCLSQCAECAFVTRWRKQLSQELGGVAAVSGDILDRHLQHGYFTRTQTQDVVRNSVNLPSNLAKSQKASADVLKFGFLGRVEKFKGIEMLLAVFERLPPDKVSLNIAGRGRDNYLSWLKSRWSKSNINYLGFTAPADFFPSIDVLVVPSLCNDPAPRVVLEAFAYGIPVLAFDSGGTPEMIEDGVSGWLVPKGDDEALLNRLKRIVGSETDVHAMSRQCLKRAADFTTEKMVMHYEKLYERAVQTGPI